MNEVLDLELWKKVKHCS